MASKSLSRSLGVLLALGAGWSAGIAAAGDGVIEINQTCAEQTGCFPGDLAGFPVRINRPGSYRLTSDLIMPPGPANPSGVDIRADFVTLDLAGFSIRGDNACAGIPPLEPRRCDRNILNAFDRGIISTKVGTEIRNGRVSGFGDYGIDATDAWVLKNVHVTDCGRGGVRLMDGGVARGNQISLNGSAGLVPLGPSVFRGNVMAQNGGQGLVNAGRSVLEGNTARGNMFTGLEITFGSVIADNTAVENGSYGIRGQGSPGVLLIRRNTVTGNGIGSNSGATQRDGINCLADCNITENTVRGNVGFGLELFRTSAYSRNIITNNIEGGVSGGVNRGHNLCVGPGVGQPSCP